MGEVADLGESWDGREIKEEGVWPTTTVSADGKIIAPFLRVEELKDDSSVEVLSGYSSGSACSSVYGTDDECALSGEASDQDRLQEVKTEPDFEKPSDELKKRIVDQVEFYFSNENIIHDAFMLKHVRRNKLGYVSLKLVTSFRKVKSLTKDYRVVAHCLHSSEKLEVNDEGTKVRRKDPLPDYDETTPSRTIVAINLLFENPTVEDIAEQFSKFGEISLIRVLRPGKQVPQDVKKYLTKYPDIGNTVCALIEYEKHESAMAAFNKINGGGIGETWKAMKVILLAPPKKKTEKQEKATEKESTGGKISQNEGLQGDSEPKDDQKKLTKCDEHIGVVGRTSLTPIPDPNRLSPCGSPRSTPRTSPRSSPRSSPRASPTSLRRRSGHGPSPLAANISPENRSRGGHESPSQSPWVQRRLKAQEESSLAGNSPGTSPRILRKVGEGNSANGVKSTDTYGVMRQPKGPNGTRGFQLTRTVTQM